MLPIEFQILIVIILTLVVLIIGSYLLLAIVCWRILSSFDHRMRNVDNSQTTQQQYMYMIRGDIHDIKTNLEKFFAVYRYVNPAWSADEEIRRQQEADRIVAANRERDI